MGNCFPPLTRAQSNENIAPQVLRQVARELNSLAGSPPDGIKVHVNEEDITDIQATITGPGGICAKCLHPLD